MIGTLVSLLLGIVFLWIVLSLGIDSLLTMGFVFYFIYLFI